MTGQYVETDADAFTAGFGRAAFLLAHHLSDHPLLGLERIAALAATLPSTAVEYTSGDLAISANDPRTPGNGLTAEETIQGIEKHNSWMVLHNLEQVPAYRELLMGCVSDIARHSERTRPGMCQPEAYLFLSSASATTPYHMDPEHSFLLQIRGRKTVTVFDGSQPAVLTPADLERYYSGVRHRGMPLPESAIPFGRSFALAPGDGIHIPVTFPHYVRVEPGTYSISFSVTFRTPDLFTRADAHFFNGFLRRRGLHPRPPGDSALVDTAKAQAGRLVRRLGKLRT